MSAGGGVRADGLVPLIAGVAVGVAALFMDPPPVGVHRDGGLLCLAIALALAMLRNRGIRNSVKIPRKKKSRTWPKTLLEQCFDILVICFTCMGMLSTMFSFSVPGDWASAPPTNTPATTTHNIAALSSPGYTLVFIQKDKKNILKPHR